VSLNKHKISDKWLWSPC